METWHPGNGASLARFVASSGAISLLGSPIGGRAASTAGTRRPLSSEVLRSRGAARGAAHRARDETKGLGYPACADEADQRRDTRGHPDRRANRHHKHHPNRSAQRRPNLPLNNSPSI
jgi:hypothetical protein